MSTTISRGLWCAVGGHLKTDDGMEVSVVPLEETVPWKYTWGGREAYPPENG